MLADVRDKIGSRLCYRSRRFILKGHDIRWLSAREIDILLRIILKIMHTIKRICIVMHIYENVGAIVVATGSISFLSFQNRSQWNQQRDFERSSSRRTTKETSLSFHNWRARLFFITKQVALMLLITLSCNLQSLICYKTIIFVCFVQMIHSFPRGQLMVIVFCVHLVSKLYIPLYICKLTYNESKTINKETIYW